MDYKSCVLDTSFGYNYRENAVNLSFNWLIQRNSERNILSVKSAGKITGIIIIIEILCLSINVKMHFEEISNWVTFRYITISDLVTNITTVQRASI